MATLVDFLMIESRHFVYSCFIVWIRLLSANAKNWRRGTFSYQSPIVALALVSLARTVMRSASVELSDSEGSTLVQSWIGCQKKYSEGVPPAVRAHPVAPRRSTRHRTEAPALSLPLKDLLALSKDLPQPDGRLVTAPTPPFSKDMSDPSTVRHLWMRGIPSKAFVDNAEKQVRPEGTSRS